MNDAPTQPLEDWNLLPLTPSFIEAEHGGYAAAIIKALDQPGVLNIALSGNYGVGKSSILQRVTELRKDKVVELSLSTLAPIEKSKLDESVPIQATTPTNQIQQEIVKQLLYREEPDKTPGSRFRRIERFIWQRQLAAAGLAGFGVTLLFLIAGWGATIVAVLKPLVDMGLWVYPILLGIATGASFAVAYLFQGRLRIKQFSAGPAAVTLDENSVSYFDQYLDEIVYFFETSKRDVVIFEDIDRFNNSHIFETLRSLNTLLNASPQIEDPVRFVYAIKDSIFDRIGLELEGRKADTALADISDPAQAEAVRANRTKFFDLVIPVVPFITHRSARNLTARILSGITHDISTDLTDLAGRFVPDMRLLKNVRNEFVVFRDRIFSGGGELLQLSETDLFAMMLYKSTHLGDFEVIRLGTSKLDKLYEMHRQLVAENIRRLGREARATRRKMTTSDNSATRSAILGKCLVEQIDRIVRVAHLQPSDGQYLYGTTAKTAKDLKSPEFWVEYATIADPPAIGWHNPTYGRGRLTFKKSDVVALVGDPLNVDAWSKLDRDESEALLSDHLEALKFLRSADIGDVMRRSEFLVEYEGTAQSLASIAEQLLTRGLAVQLLRAGFINRNFTLYTSTFHGDRVSPAATNFIIHHVERDLMDEYFILSDSDVDAVVRERGAHSLGEPAVYNIAILDRLLRTNVAAADVMIGALARFDIDGIRFIQAYLTNGAERTAFIKRIVRQSQRTLTYLISEAELDAPARAELVSIALANLARGVTYQVTEEVAAYLREHYGELPVLLSNDMKAAAAFRVSSVLEAAKVRVAALSELGVNVRAAFISRNLYVVDRPNLMSALGENKSLALDSIRSDNDTVYKFVLRDLQAYIAAVDGYSASNDTADGFVSTIKDVYEADPDQLETIIERSSPESQITKIGDVPEEAWPPLAKHRRLSSTFANIHLYIEKIGSLDSNVAEVLSNPGSLVVADTRTQAQREVLALTILESRDVLDSEVRVKLVESLGLTSYIEVNKIIPEHGALFVHLLKKDVIEDDAETFARLTQTNWMTREGVINASSNAELLITPAFIGPDLSAFLRSEAIEDSIKMAVVERADEFVANTDEAGFVELARFAIQHEKQLSIDVVQTMASNGVVPQDVLTLLQPYMAGLIDEQLFGILHMMRGVYAQLAAVGRDKPKLPNTPATLDLLISLQQRGIVNTFDRDENPIRVNKKHK